jgi:hypothetical protein
MSWTPMNNFLLEELSGKTLFWAADKAGPLVQSSQIHDRLPCAPYNDDISFLSPAKQ